MAQRLFRRMPDTIDWRDEACLEGLLATADALVDRSDSLAALRETEWLLAGRPDEWPLSAHIAVKLALSKALRRARRRPLALSVVVPVYLEHERMLRPHEHPLGEGLLDRKLRQLDWLIEGDSRSGFELIIVDDGCPEGSGHLARRILADRHPAAPARVLFLDEAIRTRHPVTRSMTSTDQSHKGGAVQLGLYEATKRTGPDHVVLYTDADLSTHLGQSGLLVEALDRPGTQVAAGSRRSRTSIVVKSSARSTRGRLFIYLWKQLLPELAAVHDTQCGFKAFRGSTARDLTERSHIHDFAFDLELLLLSELDRPGGVVPVPIAWIDSEGASTTVAIAPYLPMLRRAVELQRSLGCGGPAASSFARAIDAMDERTWEHAVERLGPRLSAIDATLDRVAPSIAASELVDCAA